MSPPRNRQLGLANVSSSFNSPQYSDLRIRCNDGTIIHAHKAVVCMQSRFFANACKPGHFRVSAFASKIVSAVLTSFCDKEGQEGIVNLEIGSSEVIKAMIGYLYTHNPEAAQIEGCFTD